MDLASAYAQLTAQARLDWTGLLSLLPETVKVRSSGYDSYWNENRIYLHGDVRISCRRVTGGERFFFVVNERDKTTWQYVNDAIVFEALPRICFELYANGAIRWADCHQHHVPRRSDAQPDTAR